MNIDVRKNLWPARALQTCYTMEQLSFSEIIEQSHGFLLTYFSLKGKTKSIISLLSLAIDTGKSGTVIK
jgi:hypothetical protein